ncbi:hypothetical protein [Rhizobium herbae]
MTTTDKLAIALPILIVVALILKLFIGLNSDVGRVPAEGESVVTEGQ